MKRVVDISALYHHEELVGRSLLELRQTGAGDYREVKGAGNRIDSVSDISGIADAFGAQKHNSL